MCNDNTHGGGASRAQGVITRLEDLTATAYRMWCSQVELLGAKSPRIRSIADCCRGRIISATLKKREFASRLTVNGRGDIFVVKRTPCVIKTLKFERSSMHVTTAYMLVYCDAAAR